MNQVQEIRRINAAEAKLGLGGGASWHAEYKNSAWIFVGGLSYDLTEGDTLCVFSQWGEIDDIHLVRDVDTGKSKGFAFIRYEDQRSTNLAVDNMNGTELLGRTLRVDHKDSYTPPQKKMAERTEEDLGPKKWEAGHAYKDQELASKFDINSGVDVFGAPAPESSSESSEASEEEADEDDDDGSSNGEKRELSSKDAKKKRKREKKEAKKAKKRAKKAAKKAKKKAKKLAKKAQRAARDGVTPSTSTSMAGNPAGEGEIDRPEGVDGLMSKGEVAPRDGGHLGGAGYVSWRGRADPKHAASSFGSRRTGGKGKGKGRGGKGGGGKGRSRFGDGGGGGKGRGGKGKGKGRRGGGKGRPHGFVSGMSGMNRLR